MGDGGVANRVEHPGRASAAWERLAARTLYDFACRQALYVLRRYRLGDADRATIAHDAVVVAALRWETYRPHLGSPRRWLRGIVANEVRRFRRAEQKPGGATAEDALSVQVAPNDCSERHQLAVMLGDLPVHQRNVVILHELHGFGYARIAKMERTSTTRAHARKVAGMEALLAAAEGDRCG